MCFSWFWSEKRHVWEKVSYHRLTGGGANVINYVTTTEEEDRATNLETVARLPASSADRPSRDPTEQNRRKMAFTFAAFCYMLALLLTAALIFFSIWHVSTHLGDISDGCRCCWEVTVKSEVKGEGGWLWMGLKLGRFSRSGGTFAASNHSTLDHIRVHILGKCRVLWL